MYEVYVTEGKDQTRWQPRPPDPELEAEMLRRLMVRLGTEDSKAKAMLAAVPTQARAKLVATEGTGVLEVQESFDRAWRRVGLALDRVGFTVEDRDRSQGIYFVRYVDPESDSKKKDNDKGFISSLMFWKGMGKAEDPASRYRIYVKGVGDTTAVQVLTREGGTDKSDTSKRILSLLLEQLK
jgi:outer membrane protein assembly factor BamC